MLQQKLFFGTRQATLYLPAAQTPLPTIYLPGVQTDTPLLADIAQKHGAVLVFIPVENWNADLSPWPAARAFRTGEDFAGCANAFLQAITADLLPQVENITGTPLWRGIAGYSLAGLFAVYTLCISSAFTRGASMSGSLWYDGFMPFLQTHAPEVQSKKIYFSLGSDEKNTRNTRLAAVEECTLAAEALLRENGACTRVAFNPGNHFANVPQRIAQGLAYLLNNA